MDYIQNVIHPYDIHYTCPLRRTLFTTLLLLQADPYIYKHLYIWQPLSRRQVISLCRPGFQGTFTCHLFFCRPWDEHRLLSRLRWPLKAVNLSIPDSCPPERKRPGGLWDGHKEERSPLPGEVRSSRSQQVINAVLSFSGRCVCVLRANNNSPVVTHLSACVYLWPGTFLIVARPTKQVPHEGSLQSTCLLRVGLAVAPQLHASPPEPHGRAEWDHGLLGSTTGFFPPAPLYVWRTDPPPSLVSNAL